MDPLSADEPWAVTAFADADLGDLRRTQRLVELATVLAQRPSASLPEACGGDRALLKATHRFFDNATLAPRTCSQAIATRCWGVWKPSRSSWHSQIQRNWTGRPTRRRRASVP